MDLEGISYLKVFELQAEHVWNESLIAALAPAQKGTVEGKAMLGVRLSGDAGGSTLLPTVKSHLMSMFRRPLPGSSRIHCTSLEVEFQFIIGMVPLHSTGLA